MVVGSIIISPTSVVPTDFLVCDGSAVSRELYSSLFDVIGTTYGDGDGVTTFNVPNLTGKTALGISSGYSLGSSGGSDTVVLDDTDIPSHNHIVPSHGHENTIAVQTPLLSHNVTQAVFKYTSLTTNVSNRYGSGYSRASYTNRTNASMSRSANLAVADHVSATCNMSGGVIASPAFNTETTGTGSAHNNMMPYIALTYLIYAPETAYPPGMCFFNGCLPVSASGCYISGKS